MKGAWVGIYYPEMMKMEMIRIGMTRMGMVWIGIGIVVMMRIWMLWM